MARLRNLPTLLVLALALVVGACGSPAATPTPATPSPVTPTPTPNPHLSDPASIDAVYEALLKAGLSIAANTAGVGTGREPIKRLNLTYEAWPLIVQQFSSAAALRKASGFDPKHKPAYGDPPYTFVGLNVLVEYGPHTAAGGPTAPDNRFRDAAAKLVVVLDLLIGPLRQRSIVPVKLPVAATPVPSAAASPSSSPKPTAKPSKKP